MQHVNLTLTEKELIALQIKLETASVPPKPPGSNYGLYTGTGSHPDCWFLSIRQGPQVFSILAETPEEKKSFLQKLQSLQKAITGLTIELEKQT